MNVEYLDLADYITIAAEVTALDTDVVMKVANLNLADSALHAPSAGFGDTEFYPDFVDEAERAVVAIASGAWDEVAAAEWLRPRLTPP